MSKTKFLFLSLLTTLFLVSSCSKDEDPGINESEVLAAYLESTDSPLMKDYVNTDMPSIMPASEVFTLNTTNQVYIIDIRNEEDFNAGHIANAHNVALANILDHIKSVDLSNYTKVAIVCYTGQTAGFAASVLRVMGYDKVFSMKWGMCAWHADFAAKWNNAVASGNLFSTQFTSETTTKGAMKDMPALSTGKSTGEEILVARAEAVLSEGYSVASVSNKSVFDNLNGYYIVNYWSEAHYTDPGHIPGAIQYTPKQSVKLSADLKTLPTDEPIVLYCYTGQTSSFLAAYLRLLGYDAKSLLYGTNGMIYDAMVDAEMVTWSESQIMGYDYE